MATMQSLYNRLQRAGYAPEWAYINDGSPTGLRIIRIETDYPGMYPDADTIHKHNDISRICGAGFRAEPRGYRTAVFISPAAEVQKHG